MIYFSIEQMKLLENTKKLHDTSEHKYWGITFNSSEKMSVIRLFFDLKSNFQYSISIM